MLRVTDNGPGYQPLQLQEGVLKEKHGAGILIKLPVEKPMNIPFPPAADSWSSNRAGTAGRVKLLLVNQCDDSLSSTFREWIISVFAVLFSGAREWLVRLLRSYNLEIRIAQVHKRLSILIGCSSSSPLCPDQWSVPLVFYVRFFPELLSGHTSTALLSS